MWPTCANTDYIWPSRANIDNHTFVLTAPSPVDELFDNCLQSLQLHTVMMAETHSAENPPNVCIYVTEPSIAVLELTMAILCSLSVHVNSPHKLRAIDCIIILWQVFFLFCVHIYYTYLSDSLYVKVWPSQEIGEFSESCLHCQICSRHHAQLTQLL